jgi:L-alanine-DL-glutamate epimerase-like enolase superfamily enzyme
MQRKEFLNLSSKSLLGLAFLGHLPGNSRAKISKLLKESNGGAMIEVKTKRLFLQHTWTISRNSSDYKDNVFVKIEKDGVIGYGEAAPNVRYGEDHEKTTDRINKVKGLVAHFDLWLNVPLYKFFGADKSKAPLTSFSIGIDTPAVIKQKVAEAEKYRILKIKVGKENDEEILNAVRSVTDKPIRVDANEGWKKKEVALEKIKWLKDMGVEFIEQPMPSNMIEETKWLRDRIDMPIVADEAVKTASDIPILAQAYDGINIKLMKAGGLQEAMRMIHMAKALDMKIMLGCMIESSIAISAAAHLSPFVDWADLDGNLLLREDPFSGVKVDRGKLILNDDPGLGISGNF